jgi:hypothetical protein
VLLPLRIRFPRLLRHARMLADLAADVRTDESEI